MNTTISQLTMDTLRAFARRRRVLIAVRGLCVGVIALLVVMSLVALVDALFVIKSSSTRWAISMAGYGVVGAIVWFTFLRSMLRIPGSRELARLIERQAPGLREDLLSAVELGSPQSDTRYDSPVFRSLLQASVERRLDGVELSALLPAGLIRGAAFATTLVLAICVALLLVPDLRFAHRLTRALLPSAPIDRLSNVQVKIIAPNPADPLVPHNDAVNVIVELTGDETDEVMLETIRSPGDRENEIITLKPSGGGRQFAGIIQLGQEPVQYRVLAGDAVTRHYTIATAARPHAVRFTKTYRFPEYASIEPTTAEDTHGNLEAIEGTSVDLIIDVDQEMTQAQLRFEDSNGDELAPIAMTRIDDQHWRASVPITSPMTYKVHLVAKATGFDNAFDPPYEIKAIADSPPVLTVESPVADMLLSPAEPLVVKLAAEDDLGLALVSKSFRINGGDWVEVALVDKPGREFHGDRPWEIYDLNLRPGDVLAVKFAATDRAGHKTETSPINVTIATTGFDPNRLAGIEASRRLVQSLAQLREATATAAKELKDEEAKLAGAGELQRSQIAVNAGQAVRELQGTAEEAWRAIFAAMKVHSAGSQADELVRIGRIVSLVRDQNLLSFLDDLDRQKKQGSSLAETLERGTAAFSLAAERAAIVHQDAVNILRSDEADALLRDLLALRQQQAAISSAGLPDEPATWQRLARRQALLAAQTKQAESLAASIVLPDAQHAEMMTKIAAQLAAMRGALEKVAANADSAASINAGNTEARQQLNQALALLLPLSRSLADVRGSSQRSLLADGFQLHLNHSSPHLSIEKNQADPLSAQEQIPYTIGGAQSLVQLMERRIDADPLWVSDIAMFRRALVAIENRRATESNENVAARHQRVAHAIAWLEAGHELGDAQSLAATQADQERWMRSATEAVTLHPRQWAATKWKLVLVARKFSEIDEHSPVAAFIASLPASSAVQILDVEMAHRRTGGAISKKRSPQLDQLSAALAEWKAKIAPQMAEARAIIAAEVPTLSQQLAMLAAEAKAVEKQASDAVAKVAGPIDEKSSAQANAVLESQLKLDEKLDDLLDALRHDANAQDTLTKDGRERARDADDATAMVRDPAAKALAAGEQAAAAEEADTQRGNLSEAAKQEQRLADVLTKLAEHYKNADEGKSEETRSALRAAESELGIKREMDAQFGRMERLADLAQKSAQEQLAALEQEVGQNPAMKQELSDIAKEAVSSAKDSLEAAAAQERRVAQDLAAAMAADREAKPQVAEQMKAISQQAGDLAQKVPAIAQNAKKGTANDAAMAANQAEGKLNQAAKVAPPENALDHEAAAKQAKALAEALEESAANLKDAQKKAAAAVERIRQEEGEATGTLATDGATPAQRQKAADTLLHAKNRQDAAKRAASDAKSAHKEAAELAEAATKLAREVSKDANASETAMEQGRQTQPEIAGAVNEAQEEVARAARHEERMDQGQDAKSLAQAADRLEKQAGGAVEKAADQLANARKPSDAQSAVAGAEKAIAGEAAKLEEMLKSGDTPLREPANAAQGEGKPGDSGEEAAKWMARALDQLDRSLNQSPASPSATAQKPSGEKPGSPSGEKPGSGEGSKGSPSASGSKSPDGADSPDGAPSPRNGEQAKQAIREAAQAQARAMAQSRQPEGDGEGAGEDAGPDATAANQKSGKPSGSSKGGKGKSPGGEGGGEKMASGEAGEKSPSDAEGSGSSGKGNRADAKPSGELSDAEIVRRGEWGKLPTRLARELMEGQRDEIPSDYRSQVEAYFRAIAQKAKAK